MQAHRHAHVISQQHIQELILSSSTISTVVWSLAAGLRNSYRTAVLHDNMISWLQSVYTLQQQLVKHAGMQLTV